MKLDRSYELVTAMYKNIPLSLKTTVLVGLLTGQLVSFVRLASLVSLLDLINLFSIFSTAAKGYDCAFCDKSTKIGTLVVLYI